jgi:hypothetical protein
MTFHFLDDEDPLGCCHGLKWAAILYAIAAGAVAVFWWSI